jgi:hypothetical protein
MSYLCALCDLVFNQAEIDAMTFVEFENHALYTAEQTERILAFRASIEPEKV